MSSEGLRTEVSTDILLYENKEMGGSGVVFVVVLFAESVTTRKIFQSFVRRSAFLFPFCIQYVKFCKSRCF